MITDLTLSPKEQLLKLINSENGTQLTLQHIEFANPTTSTGNGNTTVTLVALPNSGYSGNIPVQYNRMDLGSFDTLAEPEFTVTTDIVTPIAIVAAFNDKYGTALTIDDFDFSQPLPEADADGEVYSLTPTTTNLLYVGDLTINLKRLFTVTELTTMNPPLPTSAGAGAVLNGRLYCIGGLLNNVDYSDALSILDLETLEWTTTTQQKVTFNAAACTQNGVVYCGSGQYAYSTQDYGLYSLQGTTLVYESQFPYGHPMTTGYNQLLSYALVANDSGGIHLLGGITQGTGPDRGIVLTNHWLFNTTTKVWTELMYMPVGITNASYTFHNGKLYLISGLKTARAITSDNLVDTVYCYTLATNTWETLAPIPIPIIDGVVGVQDNEIIVYSGADITSQPTPSIQIYNIDSGTWTVQQGVEPRTIAFGDMYNESMYVWSGTYNISGNDPLPSLLKIS